jgi:hypothetical protein
VRARCRQVLRNPDGYEILAELLRLICPRQVQHRE